MIRHIVLIRFLPTQSDGQIADLFAELHAINGKITGLLAITAGKSESPEQMERGYMHGFADVFHAIQLLQCGGLQVQTQIAHRQCPSPGHKTLGQI